MSNYENRLPPEGINAGKTNVAVEVFWLMAGFALLVVVSIVVLYFAGGTLAKRMPFAWEEHLAGNFFVEATDKQSIYLQKLSDRLVKGVELPKGMRFHIRYVDDSEINAYATIGGQISLHRGLLEQLHSENAVAMVLAHEMAHIIHRDPAEAMGGRLIVALAIGIVAMGTGADALQDMLGTTSNAALLSFSRRDEQQADALGVEMVGKLYGHIGGTDEVFSKLAALEAKLPISIPEFMSTHPESIGRIKALAALAEAEGLPLTGKLTPLPPVLRSKAE